MRGWIVVSIGLAFVVAMPMPKLSAAATCASVAKSTAIENCGMAFFEKGSAEQNAKLYRECVIGEMKKQGFTEGKDFTIRVVKDPTSDLNGPVCKQQKK